MWYVIRILLLHVDDDMKPGVTLRINFICLRIGTMVLIVAIATSWFHIIVLNQLALPL